MVRKMLVCRLFRTFTNVGLFPVDENKIINLPAHKQLSRTPYYAHLSFHPHTHTLAMLSISNKAGKGASRKEHKKAEM